MPVNLLIAISAILRYSADCVDALVAQSNDTTFVPPVGSVPFQAAPAAAPSEPEPLVTLGREPQVGVPGEVNAGDRQFLETLLAQLQGPMWKEATATGSTWAKGFKAWSSLGLVSTSEEWLQRRMLIIELVQSALRVVRQKGG